VHNVNALLVFAAGRGDVTDVWVAGDQVVANRTSTKIDLADLIKRVNLRVKALDPLR
jgi:5-methylthioadenosine/S-adenosylhomocysteine deaminase